jgi:hypothetical protein
MLQFEIVPIISPLALVIIVIDVRHLLGSSSHFEFRNFIQLVT